MKQVKIKMIAKIVAMSITALLTTGCGGGGSGGSGSSGTVSGTVGSIYGTSSCIALNTTSNQIIGFSISAGDFFNGSSLFAGTIPTSIVDPDFYSLYNSYYSSLTTTQRVGQFGALAFGGAGSGGVYNTASNSYGSVSANITYNGASTYSATVTGNVTLSAAFLSAINNYSSTFYTSSYTNYSQNCLSGLALSLTVSGSTLYYGRVYLYLNGQQHGAYLQFN